ncbi:MAG TPA: ABC transporter permease [Syntrophomonadaceae bacterium]|nr:ABC transporter permease [Syntrophomonadaceae bacterium]
MKRMLGIAHYETLYIFKSRVLCFMVFLVPALYALFFGLVYYNGLISNIPMAVVDQDHSALSRELIQSFRNQPYFRIVDDVNSYDGMKTAMRDGRVRAGIVIPQDFAKLVHQGQHTQIITAYDASNLIWGFNIRRMANEVINIFNQQHVAEYLIQSGMSPGEVASVTNILDCNLVPWYNFNYSYTTFIFIGIMMLVIHQVGLFSISLTVTREKEKNSWIQFLAAPIPAWQLVTGKCLPYFLANFLNYTVLLVICGTLARVSLQGQVALVIALGLLYDVIITLLGFLISLYVTDSLQATRYLMMISFPLFFLSGLTWPQLYMPISLVWLGRLLPSTWMMTAARMVNVKGLGWSYMGGTFLVMSAMAAVLAVLVLNFPHQRRIHARHVYPGPPFPDKEYHL